jgi:hypothetical protein
LAARTTLGTLALQDCHLYAIASPADLARRLGTTLAELEALAENEAAYKVWERRDGREVEEPVPRLQRIHARVHLYLARVLPPSYLHSTLRGRSYVTNARAHVGTGTLLKIDVKKFFRSVPRAAIYRLFHVRMRCKGDASGLLAKVLTFRGHLPTGSSSSPILAYYAFAAMFDEIHDLATSRGLIATCYVDDITLSGSAATPGVLHEVRQIIARYGLRSHKAKVVRSGRPRRVTGVIVTADGIRLPNRRHQAIARGFDELRAATTADEKLRVLNPLVSRLHEAGMIEPLYKARARTLEPMRQAARRAALQASEEIDTP